MKHIIRFGFTLLLPFICLVSKGQASLAKKISLEVSRQRMDNVLEILSNKAGFYFSYNSNIIKKDSLVSFNASNKSVKEVLSILFNNTYEFRESGNYIIIRKAPIRMTLVTQKSSAVEKVYAVSGFVYDDQTGSAINEASIYEKKFLSSALTNNDGFFKLKLKSSKASVAELTISKAFYEDTTVKIATRYNQQLTIALMPVEEEANNVIVKPENILEADPIPVKTDTIIIRKQTAGSDTLKVERSGLAKLLLSGKQKVRSLNLNKFFTTRPIQVSFTPAIGTHGKMSAQVVNNFSLNVLGGYTGGTNGLEIGGLFNIDKKNVQYVQAAGIFNSVGGRVKGLQVAGINNLVLDGVFGLQAAGINNMVKGKMKGLQIGGVYNHVTDSVRGMQVAGVANFSRKKTNGLQVGGVANISSGQIDGVQIAGLVNYAKKLKGLQIAVINIADSSEGYSIGLINIVLKGYHKISFYTNEITPVNAAFKSGNSRLYSILSGGLRASDSNRVYAFGYGLGSEIPLDKKKTFFLNPELSCQYLYLGSWDYTNIVNRLNLNVNVKLGKYISLFAGPSYTVYTSDQKAGNNGYLFPIPPSGYTTHKYSNKVTGWIGWNAGINIF
ncbi:MAG: STN domain-containing protein [Ferruginibacter sp.]